MNESARTAYRTAYRTAELTTLTQRELIIKLYEGVERFLVVAQDAMKTKQIERCHIHCTKAKAIFEELLSTLSFENGGEIAQRLLGLYTFFLRQITEANLRKKPELIAELMPIIANLRSAWEAIPAELADHSTLADSQGHSFSSRS